jgi:long-chain acyl-CoA synthetase
VWCPLVLHIINHAEIAVIITEKENTRKLIQLIPKLTHLRYIVQYDNRELYNTAAEFVDEKDVKDAAEQKVKLIGYSQMISNGEAKLSSYPLTLPKPNDLAFVMYTSGTTGIPKGALLRHSNVVAAVAAVPVVFKPASDDVHISYLPLAHIFETIIQVSLYAYGNWCLIQTCFPFHDWTLTFALTVALNNRWCSRFLLG